MKEERYYLDTSIWLDLFENRGINGEIAKEFFRKIIITESKIIFSEAVKDELLKYGFHPEELNHLLSILKANLVYVMINREQFGKAQDFI